MSVKALWSSSKQPASHDGLHSCYERDLFWCGCSRASSAPVGFELAGSCGEEGCC